jgi:hypothetical protein
MPQLSPEEVISLFLKQTFDPQIWQEHWIEIISYVFAPVLLLFLLIYAILHQIRFFGADKKINVAISILLVLFALISGFFNSMAVLISTIGATFVAALFFIFLFSLFLSAYFSKKAEDFGFPLGSRYLSKVLIYFPVLILLVFGAVFLLGFDGMSFFLHLKGFKPSIFIIISLHATIALFLVRLYKKDFLLILIVSAFSIIILFPQIFGADKKTSLKLFAISFSILVLNTLLAFPKIGENIMKRFKSK